MRLTAALFGTFCFADNVLSAVPLAMDGFIHRRHADVHNSRATTLERRVPQPQASGTANASADALTAWNQKAEAACMSKLASLGGTVSNPSGMAVCYQVPFMDTKSGTFEAELIMYNVSTPSQDWAGVTAQEMMVSLAYLGATVQRTNDTAITPNTTPTRREVSEAELQSRAELSKRQTTTPPLSILSYIGSMNPNIKGTQMNETAIQAFLIPEVELSAMNPNTKQMVYTVLSSKDATFMSGLFDTASTNTITAAAAASASSIADMSMIFIIPGLDFGLFPVGLIVTMVWVGLFAAFVGLGTLGRYQFREQYIRNMKREMGANVKTI